MSHHHGSEVSRKLIIATIATIAFVVVELVVGFTANSLALVGDALHNLTDSLALLLAWIAVRLERRPPTSEKSYGYQRAGILAAFLNAATLVGFTVYIFIEAFHRFRNPHVVNDRAMLFTAIVAIVLNTAITFSLRREGREDVNIRAAVVHMLGDAVSSVGIVIAALIIRSTGNPIWDPAISIVIGVLILWSSWGILSETVNLLLEGTPAGIEPDEVSAALSKMNGVYGVHHLHIWALGPSSPAMSCHVMVGDVPMKATGKLLAEMNAMLEKEYGIAHITIQFEFANCAEDDLYCLPYTESGATGFGPSSR
jgi:cobalt-zinc-cadmium efflux system protein